MRSAVFIQKASVAVQQVGIIVMTYYHAVGLARFAVDVPDVVCFAVVFNLVISMQQIFRVGAGYFARMPHQLF